MVGLGFDDLCMVYIHVCVHVVCTMCACLLRDSYTRDSLTTSLVVVLHSLCVFLKHFDYLIIFVWNIFDIVGESVMLNYVLN